MNGELNALIWFCLLPALALGYFLWQVWHSDYDLWESSLYLPTYVMGRLVWRVYFKNEAPQALRQGALLVANHRSSVDPFFVQLAARRRVHWMVAKEYCQHFLFGRLLRLLEVIPTNRSGLDTASTKAAMRLTRAGKLVGMFPEGRLNQTNRLLLPIRSGAALVALRSEVPIVPLLIEGSPLGKSVWSPLFIPARVGITFGQPIWPDPTRDDPSGELHVSDALIVQWARQIVELAGHAGYSIELASKRKRRKST